MDTKLDHKIDHNLDNKLGTNLDAVITINPLRKHDLTAADIQNTLDKKNKKGSKQMLKFISVLLLTLAYFFIELIFGIKIGSIGLITDAVHMLSDVIAILIAIYAHKASYRPNTNLASYGSKRMQILGGFVNGLILLVLSFTLIGNALDRIIRANYEGDLEENDTLLIIIAAVGLFVNILSLLIFHEHDHDHEHKDKEKNPNIHGMLLHILGDAFSSICVVISGLIIKYTTYRHRFLSDPISSLIISIVIIIVSVPLIIKTSKILLQYVPTKIDLNKLKENILLVRGVKSIHELHIWQLDTDITILIMKIRMIVILILTQYVIILKYRCTLLAYITQLYNQNIMCLLVLNYYVMINVKKNNVVKN
jgi:cation diffusion facilitator family transporter